MSEKKGKKHKWLHRLLWTGSIATLAYVGTKIYFSLKSEKEIEEKSIPPVDSTIDELKIKIGHELFPLVDKKYGSKLLERIPAIRKQIRYELGFPLPVVRIVDDLFLEDSYVICIKGIEVATGKIMPGKYMAIKQACTDDSVELDGVEVVEPTHNIPAIWIDESECKKAIEANYLIVDPLTVMLTHMKETFIRHAPDILGLQETKKLLDDFKHIKPVVVDEVIPEVLNLVDVNKVLQRLLAERVSVRNLGTILETLADYGRHDKDIHNLVEHVRQALGRQITESFLNSEGNLDAVHLSSELESQLIEMHEVNDELDIESKIVQDFLKSLSEKVDELQKGKVYPVLICPSKIRPHIRKITQRILPNLAVLSYDEIPSDIKVEVKEVIGTQAKGKESKWVIRSKINN